MMLDTVPFPISKVSLDLPVGEVRTNLLAAFSYRKNVATKDHFGCPVQATANTIAGKWKVLIVWHLSFASRRFGELRGLLPGVSEKVLAAQLRELERDGIVRRISAETLPPRVDYTLSSAGQELIPIMEAMCNWGTQHLGVLPTLPRKFDRQVLAH